MANSGIFAGALAEALNRAQQRERDELARRWLQNLQMQQLGLQRDAQRFSQDITMKKEKRLDELHPLQLENARLGNQGIQQSLEQSAMMFPEQLKGARLGNQQKKQSIEQSATLFPVELQGAQIGNQIAEKNLSWIDRLNQAQIDSQKALMNQRNTSAYTRANQSKFLQNIDRAYTNYLRANGGRYDPYTMNWTFPKGVQPLSTDEWVRQKLGTKTYRRYMHELTGDETWLQPPKSSGWYKKNPYKSNPKYSEADWEDADLLVQQFGMSPAAAIFASIAGEIEIPDSVQQALIDRYNKGQGTNHDLNWWMQQYELRYGGGELQ